MAKADVSFILARAKASLAGKPAPVNPAIVHELAPASQPSSRPMAELLAGDAVVPETEWEKALRLAQDRPKLRLGKSDPDLNLPRYAKGHVGPSQGLSQLPAGEASADAMKATQVAKVEAKAQAEWDAPYTGTPQQKIAYHNAKAKAARGHKLTKAEKHIMYKFNRAYILRKPRYEAGSRAITNPRKAKG